MRKELSKIYREEKTVQEMVDFIASYLGVDEEKAIIDAIKEYYIRAKQDELFRKELDKAQKSGLMRKIRRNLWKEKTEETE